MNSPAWSVKRCLIALFLMAVALYGATPGPSVASVTEKPLRIILDTDISSDADDVGAVAVLHALAAKGDDIHILAMMVSSGDPYSVACLSVLNSYFLQPDIPIGRVSGRSVRHDSAYTRTLSLSGRGSPNEARDAVELYRDLLARQPDHSVTIVTVGYLTNLKNLLRSGPDEYSSLNGEELVQKKVRLMVCMGGEYPAGREWNFYQDTGSTRYVIQRWPTRIVFAGFELGRDIITGRALAQAPAESPVRQSYLLHNDFQGRPSWDQLAVLYAAESAEGAGSRFVLSGPGSNTIGKDGSNEWKARPGGSHFYLSLGQDAQRIGDTIDNLMMGN